MCNMLPPPPSHVQVEPGLLSPPTHLQVEEARQPVYARDVIVLQEE